MNLQGFRTIIGVLIAAAPTFATMFGYDTAPSFEGDATELVSALITIIGSAVAIYFRLIAVVPGWFAKK